MFCREFSEIFDYNIKSIFLKIRLYKETHKVLSLKKLYRAQVFFI